MTAQIISIGDELLIGQVINTNTAYIGQALTGVGMPVMRTIVVGDQLTMIEEAVTSAWAESDLVILTGGLGPTHDDKTVEALSQFFDTPLVFSEVTWKRLQALFSRFGKKPTDSHRQQCYVPQSAQLLVNNMGTAPGMHFRREDKHLFVMPGVPYEMQYIMDTHVIPIVQAGISGIKPIVYRTICTVGEGESRLAKSIEDIEDTLPDGVSLAYLPRPGRVRIRVTCQAEDQQLAENQVGEVAIRITDRIQEFVYAQKDISLAEAVGEMLKTKGLMLSVAESCTGGYLGHLITSVPGSSTYFAGGGITYSNTLKMQSLNVSAETLKQYGAVSRETAIEMSTGALNQFKTDIAVAITGVAGPDGGTEDKPVGLVWISVADHYRIEAVEFRFGKDRSRNIELSAISALNMVRKFLTRT